MPLTPFHVGPGLLLKSGAPRFLSVVSFAATTIAIDLEPLYYLSRHEWPLHRGTHTFLAAGVIGLLVGAVVAAAARMVVRGPTPTVLKGEMSIGPAMLGGVLGGLSHPLLDGLLYADIHPFEPFTAANPLLGLVSSRTLLAACVVSGVLGLVIVLARLFVRKPLD